MNSANSILNFLNFILLLIITLSLLFLIFENHPRDIRNMNKSHISFKTKIMPVDDQKETNNQIGLEMRND